MHDVRRIGGGRGLCGGPGKRVDRVLTGRFRHQRADQWTMLPGRGGMAQNGGTRGERFYGEMDHCRESQGWTTACSRMPERDGKDQGEDRPKQAGSFGFDRPCCLATSGANLFPPGVWRLVCRCHDVFFWCYICFQEKSERI